MDTSSRRSGVLGNSGDGRKAGAAMVPMRLGASTGIHLHCMLACPPLEVGRRRRCPAYTISASLLYLPLANKCAGGGAELALHERFALVNSSTAQSHAGPALRGNAAPAYAFVVSPLAATVRTYPESFAAAALGQNEWTAGKNCMYSNTAANIQQADATTCGNNAQREKRNAKVFNSRFAVHVYCL